jgi:hypothetical protein
MIKSIPSFFLGAIAVALFALSLDSWLYAGHFLHFGQGAHISINGGVVPDAWAEFFAGAVVLGISNSLSRGGNHLTSLCISLMGIALVGLAANMYFGVGWLPQWLVPAHAQPLFIAIAGVVACATGYDLAPGSFRRARQSSNDKTASK